jgi:hypothetical protein
MKLAAPISRNCQALHTVADSRQRIALLTGLFKPMAAAGKAG